MTEPLAADALVVAIDQGTSSTKVVVLDGSGAIVARASANVGQSHPRPGWVEQDAEEIFASVLTALTTALDDLGSRVVAVGISSQRESALAWDSATGAPLGPMLGWQDRRTIPAAQQLAVTGHGRCVREISGLPIDPMFSALKFAWLLDDVDPDRSRSAAGEIAVGTVDSWLLFKLTGEHRIERGNASRTQLLDVESGEWSPELLELFRIPVASLPTVVSSTEPSAPIVGVPSLPADLRVTAVLGDSHAALYGHGARIAGDVKVTYGTGSSVMGLLPAATGEIPGLVRTIAWDTGALAHAFEGNILSTGATLVWVGSLFDMSPPELSDLAETVEDTGGVSLVPAFAGLGAPWWDDEAQAILSGFSLGTNTAQVARAAFESIAMQVEDVLRAADVAQSSGSGSGSGGDSSGGDSDRSRIGRILADGGPTSNAWLMQLQADLSQRTVVVPAQPELSAIGVAHLAGEVAGVWAPADVAAFRSESTTFHPVMSESQALAARERWLTAVARARSNPPQITPLQRSTQ